MVARRRRPARATAPAPMATSPSSPSAHAAASTTVTSAIVEQVEHGGDDRGVSGHRRRELGDAAAHRRCGIGTGTGPRGEGVAGCAADERAERGGAHAWVGVTVAADASRSTSARCDGGPVTEGGELGRTRDRARVGHGNRPLIAMTRPAKMVATTAATRKPVTPTRTTMRDQRPSRGAPPAHPRAGPGARRTAPSAWQAEGRVYPTSSRLLRMARARPGLVDRGVTPQIIHP